MMQRFPVAWQCRIDSFNTPEPLGTTLKDKIEPHNNVLKLFPLDDTKVFHFYDSAFALSIVPSRYQSYSFSSSKRKLILNSALFILPFREFYA